MTEITFLFQLLTMLAATALLSFIVQMIKRATGKPPSPRPLGVRLISGWYLWLAIWYGIRLADPVGIDAMGFRLTDVMAFFYQLVLMLICAGLSLGIWHLREPVRRIAFGFETYYVLDAVMILLNPFTLGPFLDAWRSAGFSRVEGFIYLACQSILLSSYAAIRIWLLIKKRRAFKGADLLEQYLRQASESRKGERVQSD
jgi:hypothetical protein